MTDLAGYVGSDIDAAVELDALGTLTPISRSGGQGRVYQATHAPHLPGGTDPVVKLYRAPPPAEAAEVLAEMVAWGRRRPPDWAGPLGACLDAWPLATVIGRGGLAGIVMRDIRPRYQVPFTMPSGRSAGVLLSLEHLLEGDDYLLQRGLDVRLDTRTRLLASERISLALSLLHRQAIVASDISPNNLLLSFPGAVRAGSPGAGAASTQRSGASDALEGPDVCFIDCDSMVFRGRQALTSVQTADWNVPAAYDEPATTRSADAYKLGLIVLRLLARSHDARELEPHARHVPLELHGLLRRALSAEAPNRPPAGEWQLALRGLRSVDDVNRLYPGPRRERARAASAASAAAASSAGAGVARPADAAGVRVAAGSAAPPGGVGGGWPAGRAAVPPRRVPAGVRSQRLARPRQRVSQLDAVTALLVLVLVVVLGFLFVRLAEGGGTGGAGVGQRTFLPVQGGGGGGEPGGYGYGGPGYGFAPGAQGGGG